jgi:peptidoglycan hydrolase-like protein with peptidoglycan-binding domain
MITIQHSSPVRPGLCALAAAMIVAFAPVPAAAQRSQGVQEAPAVTSIDAAYIRGIQEELRAQGYDVGPIDGIAGTKTRGAISRYQNRAGLIVDSKPSPTLLDHMKFVQPKAVPGVSAVSNAPREATFDTQRALAERGYYDGPIDGIAGPMTRAALQRFRQDAGQAGGTSIEASTAQTVRDAPGHVRAIR